MPFLSGLIRKLSIRAIVEKQWQNKNYFLLVKLKISVLWTSSIINFLIAPWVFSLVRKGNEPAPQNLVYCAFKFSSVLWSETEPIYPGVTESWGLWFMCCHGQIYSNLNSGHSQITPKKIFLSTLFIKKKITKQLLNNINFIQSTTLGTFSIKQVG